jgi:F-type H+-transporting ATPase subunit b
LEAHRARLLTEARDDAEQERKALERSARDAAEQRKREWLQQVEEQRAEFLRDLRRRSTEHFYALARKALAELAHAQLEEQIIRVFLEKLTTLDKDTKKNIAAEGRKAGNTVAVRSRFEIPASEKRQITKTIHDQILDGAEVAYEQSPRITCGLELRAGGQTVSWSLDSYFDSLESRIEKDIRSLPSSSE